MRYADMILDECYNGPHWGCTFAVQGCHKCCPGCFNPETWDFDGGKEFNSDVLYDLIKALSKPYIKRLSIQGGEPLCKENLFITCLICDTIRRKYPDIKIYIWTGYTKEELEETTDPKIKKILDGTYADYLIDGPFIEAEKDLSLFMRGSKNQRIIKLNKGDT